MSKLNEVEDIPGYEGLYGVNYYGKVWSYRSNVFLKQKLHKFGYCEVNLKVNGKQETLKVHRLLAILFIPNPENKPCVNHINGIKDDNRIENLEWCTHMENIRHAVSTGLIKITTNQLISASRSGKSTRKLSYNQANDIRNLFKEKFSRKELSKMFNVSTDVINLIIKNKTYMEE